MGVNLNYPLFAAEDSSGAPLSGGLLYTYIAGTTTAKATYTTRAMAVANANPVVLDSRGEAVVYGAGLYKLILRDSAGTLIWTQDNVQMDTGAGSFVFYVDPSETDHGAAGNGASLYDILIANGGTKKYTVRLAHNGVGNTTSYAVGTTFDASAYTNVNFEFDMGAVLTIATGVTLTLPGPEYVKAGRHQQIASFTGTAALSWGKAGTAYPTWTGCAGDGTTDDTLNFQRLATGLAAGSTVDGAGLSYKIDASRAQFTTLDFYYLAIEGASSTFTSGLWYGVKFNNGTKVRNCNFVVYWKATRLP